MKPLSIRFDSTYAAHVSRAIWCAQSHTQVADKVGFCKRCRAEGLKRDIVWPFIRCTKEGWAIPEGMEKCRTCKQIVKHKFRHEAKCRGNELATRTCNKCGEVFPRHQRGYKKSQRTP